MLLIDLYFSKMTATQEKSTPKKGKKQDDKTKVILSRFSYFFEFYISTIKIFYCISSEIIFVDTQVKYIFVLGRKDQ